MRSDRRKEQQQNWFEEQIVSGTNPVKNSVFSKEEQKMSKRSNQRMKEIPQYASQKLKEIELQISKVKLNEQSNSQINQCTNSIICLMTWIWQCESHEYKSQKSKKRIKKNPQNQEDIDGSKCIRKLFELFNKKPEFFSKSILLSRDIIQRNGIKTKLLKNQQKAGKSSKTLNHKDSHENFEEVSTAKNYTIYQTYRNLQKMSKNEEQISLLTLFLEIIVLSYDSVVLLDLSVANSVIQRFTSSINTKKGTQTNKECFVKQRILQQLVIFAFSELQYLKIVQVNSQQALSSIGKKKNSQSILWNFFADLVKMLNFRMKQKIFAHFNLENLEILKTAQILVSQFTHFAKRNWNQTGEQIKTSEVQSFFQTFIARVVEAQAYLIDLKESKNSESNNSLKAQVLNYRFELLLYDWALLVIRNGQNEMFKKIVEFCKKLFFKYIEEKNADFKQNFKGPYQSNVEYSRFTIKEDPNQFSEGKSKIEENQLMEIQSQRYPSERNHGMIKNILAVPHMRLLIFKENMPLSAKRRHEKKQESKKQGQEDYLIFLLILYNRSYIIQLLQQIEFIEPDWLDPEIGKGLVKFCTYCNKFTSLILSERYFKILSSKPHHHNLLQSVFQKDVDYQRRLSQSRQSYHSINKVDSFNASESSNSNNDDKKEKSETNQQEQVLKVRLKSCESIFFEMISEIQNKVPLLKLQTYIDEALKKPQIFRAQVFYQRLLETQNTCYGREYLSELIIRWIDHQLRFFNILTYFDIFVKKCLFSEEGEQFAQLIEGLPISKLIKLHSLLLAQTFAEQSNLRIGIPQGISALEKLQLLTSGGYQQKTRLVDKYFNEMTEIILWDKYLKILTPLQNIEKYVFIKSYFSLIFYSFSGKQGWNKNEQKLIFLIEKLKIDIQKDKVDEVCSIFHFLTLALFPNISIFNLTPHDSEKKKGLGEGQSSKTRYFLNCKQKIIEQILYIIRQNHRQIIDMFKNKESMTIKYLSEDIRRKSFIDTNSDVEDMKRKQVSKMLNKQKVMHDYLIKTIVRFLQNIEYTENLLKNFHSPEDFISTTAEICKREYLNHDQKFIQSQKTLYTPKLNYFLSSVSSSHQFQMGLRRELKRFEENFQKHHNRYGFLVMIRFIAEKWVQEKYLTINSRPSQKVKSKQTKSAKQSGNDTKNKQKISSITNLISIENIFKICLQVIEIRFGSSVVLRQSEVLKQKIICLQTICFLSHFIIQNSQFLQISSLSVIKAYRSNFHSKMSSIITRLLMNNEAILGKNERQLVLHMRFQALCYLIENYTSNVSYDSEEWRLMKDRKSFWFLINCLIFDKSAELRFYIVKCAQSRFSNSPEFRGAICQKLTMFKLMAVEEPQKFISQLAKKALSQNLQRSLNLSSNKGLDLLLSSLMGCIQFMVNFNLMNILQRDEKRLNEKVFFENLIDLIFEKGEMESYLFSLVQNFKSLISCKNENQLLKIIKPLEWDHILNIDFYLTSKTRVTKYNPIQKNKHQNKKMYLQLIKQLKQQADSQSYSQNDHSNRSKLSKKSKNSHQKNHKFESQFLQLLQETLKVIQEVFKLKLARSNKKFVKTRKAVGLIVDTPIGPNLSRNMNSTQNKSQNIISGQNLRSSGSDIEI